MAAALTGDQAVLTLLFAQPLCPIATAAAAASDRAAQAAHTRHFQAMPLLWLSACVGFVPLFAFWAAEDPLSTSGHDWVGRPIIHSSCPGDAVTCVHQPIRCPLLLVQTQTDKLMNRLEKIIYIKD